jgi:hypothetical protein
MPIWLGCGSHPLLVHGHVARRLMTHRTYGALKVQIAYASGLVCLIHWP